jgi:hypothetical protein
MSERPPDTAEDDRRRDDLAALSSLRKLVRTRRLGHLSHFDVLYRVYVTALMSLFGFYLALGLIDDAPIGAAEITWVRDHGASWVGALAALAVAAGVRSGTNGGPLVIDEVDLHHVLLSPIDRRVVLRSGVRNLVAGALALGAVAGAAAGELATRRLPGNPWAWVGAGTLSGITITTAGVGAALVAASLPVLRQRPWITSGVAIGLVGWSVADIALDIESAPTTAVGLVALWALDFSWWPIVAPVAAAGLVTIGARNIARLSIERAGRRAHLIRQVRFALAQQDVRSLILLRRQLGFERPRGQPLVRLGSGRLEARVPALYRDLRSYLRWPLQRVVRVGALSVLTGLALAGMWRGTTALVLGVAAGCYLASLEAVEPLSQELDHPSILEAAPVNSPTILVFHISAAAALMSLWWAGATAVAAAVTGSVDLFEVLAVASVPAAAAAVGGAAISTKRVGSGISSLPVPDEIAGPQTVIRLVWPIALAGLGGVPVIVARAADDRGADAVAASVRVTIAIAALAAVMFVWIRVRDDLLAIGTQARVNQR